MTTSFLKKKNSSLADPLNIKIYFVSIFATSRHTIHNIQHKAAKFNKKPSAININLEQGPKSSNFKLGKYTIPNTKMIIYMKQYMERKPFSSL